MDGQKQDQQIEDSNAEYGTGPVIGGDMSIPNNMPQKAVKSDKFGFMKRKPVLIGLAVLIAAAGAGGFLLTRDKVQEPVASDTGQTSRLGVSITLIDGKATYKSGEGEWQTLATETELSEGDWVSTDADSRTVLSFDDGSAFRLDGSTIIQLTSLAANDIEIEQTAGTAYSRVVASEREFTVSIGETGYTAMGTAFTTVSSGTSKGVQVLQSSVKIEDVSESVAEGKQYFKEHDNAELVDKQTDISLDELKSSGFMLWNLEQDEKDDKFKDNLGYLGKVKEITPEPEPEPTGSNGIQLSVWNDSKGTVLSWGVSGVDVSKGFKIVRSHDSSSPTFGKDEAVYVDSPSARSYTWKGDSSNKTYWYRVCAYRGDTCVNYSNAVQKASVYIVPAKVTRGTIVLSIGEDDRSLSWTYSGKAIYGFKVVVSSDPNPTYPEDGYAFYGGSKQSGSYTLKENDLKSGNNYVRVCAFTKDSELEKCVDYSDQLNVPKP